MIQVPPPATTPPNLVAAWEKEKERAAAAFKKGFPKKKFTFSAYAAAGVKDALEAAFHVKCAYCESLYEAVTPADIEHYRPKAKVDQAAGKAVLGYFWMAGEWTNLLPSCKLCNTPTWQKIAGKPKPEKVGKGNWFPLWDEKKRARREGDEKLEYPLLIHPYLDKAETLLEFNDAGLVSAAKGLRGKEKRKAEESIRLYGLSRERLVRVREDWGKRVTGQLQTVLDWYSAHKSSPTNKQFKANLVRQWNAFESLLEVQQPYLAMARQIRARKLKPHVEKKIRQIAKTAPSKRP